MRSKATQCDAGGGVVATAFTRARARGKVTEQFHPDWDTLDGLLIWFAQRTDLFGGGSFGVPIPLFPDAPPMRYIPAAVSDIHSSYDSVCQELGHAYGFEHPWLRSRNSRAFRNFATISQQISLIS